MKSNTWTTPNPPSIIKDESITLDLPPGPPSPPPPMLFRQKPLKQENKGFGTSTHAHLDKKGIDCTCSCFGFNSRVFAGTPGKPESDKKTPATSSKASSGKPV